MGTEGIMWYAGRQERIFRILHGILEGRGRSRGYYIVCWKAGVQRGTEGIMWFVGRGGSSGCYILLYSKAEQIQGVLFFFWKAGADPEGITWYAGRQGRIQRVYMMYWKACVDPEGIPW